MIEETGNLWSYPADYVAVTTNGIVSNNCLIMGAGVALEAKKRFPGLPAKLGKYVQQYGNRCFICPPEKIISFPTKNDWKDKSSTILIQKSCLQLIEICNKFGVKSVALPRVGCGNGGLDWNNVCRLLRLVFGDDDRFIIVHK